MLYQQVIEDFQPEVIHVHHLENQFPFAYFTASDRIPLITTVHSSHLIDFSEPSRRPLRHQFVRENLGLARNLIFVSRFVKARYEALFPDGLVGRRTWIIHNPHDSSLFSVFPKKEARRHIKKESEYYLILFVGGLIPRKGAHVLVEALGRLKTKGLEVRAMLAGEGPERTALQALIQEKELSEAISLEGPKSQEELVHYYNAADLFVLPSLMESFGVVFIEAMLCGCPVIGTPEVLQELLPGEGFGYYVPSENPQALADAIEKAHSQSWDRAKIRHYATDFDWKTRIHDFEEAYAEIVRDPSS
jgi:glycosyltransferase involved in cell wall biosynthesis